MMSLVYRVPTVHAISFPPYPSKSKYTPGRGTFITYTGSRENHADNLPLNPYFSFLTTFLSVKTFPIGFPSAFSGIKK